MHFLIILFFLVGRVEHEHNALSLVKMRFHLPSLFLMHFVCT